MQPSSRENSLAPPQMPREPHELTYDSHFVPSGFRDHLYVLIPVCAILVAFCWMVTDGDFKLFNPESFGQFYDGQAESLLAGHWDVTLKSIAPEEYFYDGKAYGYFGFLPALPRMALNCFLPNMAGAWSRTSLTLGCAATLICSYSLLLLRSPLAWRFRTARTTRKDCL